MPRIESDSKRTGLVPPTVGRKPRSARTIQRAPTSKIFFTASFQRVLLGRTLSVPKWLVAVTLDCLLSGLATVYFEKVLKTTPLTVWDRNLQLAAYSLAIYLPWALYDSPSAPFAGWSAITCLVALLGALGGILVAMVIKYADGLAKNLSTASSIVLTTAAGHYAFNGPMNGSIILGSLMVIVSGYNYQTVR
ncbi:hypothetical protein EMIHUDRAFT_231751 [Emiliania huxleyi CCMP1516]|uniref:EamA domain-containing protein n=2 Tax=Emiliania huxleyi TaxID=2903 RepID=A0A0D3K738_EMIH1|nr:hypothetical protein EMIHUDRAFT_231751 [Emiliania huxleyi CCMP1516]EOD31573.1 hypothetical protein EMIHUDRAFT_231751 [Emiliania huxleyi CCMP1516]|eukprot:XP_005784002.1 hypothetical protein EMIHUDRAFT_231751 [Emiliania huxleyi CCMP1516]